MKWFVPEALSDRADALLDGSFELLAPDLVLPEFGNLLWKKVTRHELRPDEAKDILQAFVRVPIRVVESRELIASALEIATAFRRSVYDGMYVALAVACDGTMVTADEKLVKALVGGVIGRHVQNLSAVRLG